MLISVVLVAGFTSGFGCKKNVESDSPQSEVGPADLIRVKVPDSASWTAVKVLCDKDATFEVYPLEGGQARIAGLTSEDCRMEMMPGAVKVKQPVKLGQSWKCEPAKGGGVECGDRYSDAVLIRAVGGEFKSAHVVCDKNGLDQREVFVNDSVVVHGLAGSCVVSLNPGEVATGHSVARGQQMTCHVDGNRISDCSVQ